MKRDLERWSDELTPEEERRVWSRMQSAIRKKSALKRPWPLRPWVTSTAAVAAAAVLIIAIWQAQDHKPELAQVSGPDLAAREKTSAERPTADAMKAERPDARDVKGKAQEPGVAEELEGPGKMDQPSATSDLSVTSEEESMGPAELEAAGTPEPGKMHTGQDAAGSAPGDVAEDIQVKAPKREVSGPDEATGSPGAGAESFMAATESSAAPTGGSVEVAPGPDVAVKGPATVMQEAREEDGRHVGAGEETGEEAARPRALRMEAGPPAKKARAVDRAEVRGRVTDASGNPVAHAQVTVMGTRFGAMTDENGFFVIKNMPAGTYSLRVTATGYEELLVRDVAVEKDQTKDLLALQLKEEGTTGPETIAGSEEEFIPVTSFNAMESPAAGRADEFKLKREGRGIAGLHKKDISGLYPSLTGGSRPVNDDLADDMFFQHYGTNPFIDAEEDALSTFGLDVDTGSYTICRRYIREGHLPPTDAVRVEEFVNFFRKDFPPPRRGDIRIQVDGMPSPFAHVQDGSYWLLRVGIRGRVIDERDRMPAQVVLVIDTSGSMAMENRLGLLKASMDVLLDELRPDDEIGVVAFSTKARVVLPMTPLSEGRQVYRAIESLSADGSTNAEHGLKLGYEMMRKAAREGWIHRLILCSDGVANEGNTGWEKILDNVRRESDRISLTTIGFGMGNYNDILMEQLADAGDGQYSYVDDLREATRVLRENFTGTMQTIARNAKAQIEFEPRYVDKYRLLGYENRDVRDQDFRRDDVDAGEIGAGHEVTVLYEVKLKSDVGRRNSLATVHLRYEKPDGEGVVELDERVRGGDLWREVGEAPGDLVVDACVAEFAEILRGSYWAKDGSLADVLDLLEEATEDMTSQPDIDELIDLVEEAIELKE